MLKRSSALEPVGIPGFRAGFAAVRVLFCAISRYQTRAPVLNPPAGSLEQGGAELLLAGAPAHAHACCFQHPPRHVPICAAASWGTSAGPRLASSSLNGTIASGEGSGPGGGDGGHVTPESRRSCPSVPSCHGHSVTRSRPRAAPVLRGQSLTLQTTRKFYPNRVALGGKSSLLALPPQLCCCSVDIASRAAGH